MSPERAKHTLSVLADPLTEILVIGPTFSVVPEGRGVGRLKTKLPSGVYKVRLQAGGRVRQEQQLLVEGDATLDLRSAETDPVPLGGNTIGEMFEELRAGRVPLTRLPLVLQARLGAGGGARLSFDIQHLSPPIRSSLSLWHPDGHTHLSMDVVEGRIDVECLPGAYHLRSRAAGAPQLAQVIVASPGVRTLVELEAEEAEEPRVDLGRSRIYDWIGGPGPSRRLRRLTDDAQAALQRRRNVVTRELIAGLAERKFESPLLGLYCAHLLLLADEPDSKLLATEVIGNLNNTIPDHPDLQILSSRDSSIKPWQQLDAPPMFSRSLDLVEEITPRRGARMAWPSAWETIGASRWGDGTWLVWQERENESERPRHASPGKRPIRGDGPPSALSS